MSVVMDKPKFSDDQVFTSTDIQRKYGAIKTKAKEMPLVVTDNGRFDTVILDYQYYESIYIRLQELEEQEEVRILTERLDRLDKNPELAVPWRSIRRTELDNE